MIRGNQSFQKAANGALVMRYLRSHAPVSRTEIADSLGLTKSTVSNIVNELIAAGLLREAAVSVGESGGESTAAGGGTQARGGRPRRRLELNADAAVVLGIDVRPASYDAVALDLAGEELGRCSGGVSTAVSSPGEFLELLEEIFRAARERLLDSGAAYAPPADSHRAPRTRRTLLGVGFGLPAYVDAVAGRVVSSTLFGVSDTEVAAPMAERLGIPVLIDNDANCVAWGELTPSAPSCLLTVLLRLHRDRAGRRLPSGAGIGLGIVVHGQLHYGHDFAAGEFRSIDWRASYSGQLAQDDWIPERQPESREDAASPEGEGVRRDPRTAGGTREMVRELLANLSVPISILRPERVAYAGNLLEMSDVVSAVLADELRDRYVNPEVSGCPIVPARSGYGAVAVGAGAMFLERVFAVPALGTERPSAVPSWQELLEGLRSGAGGGHV
jgi:DNA-binding Lrp family transcriptional regulator